MVAGGIAEVASKGAGGIAEVASKGAAAYQ